MESLRNDHSQEGSTEMWQLNAMYVLDGVLVKEKDLR